MRFLKVAAIGHVIASVVLLVGLGGLTVWVSWLAGTRYKDGPLGGAHRIVLQSTSHQSNESAIANRKLSWTLNFPRQFLISEVGGAWSGSHIVDISMAINVDDGSLKANPKVFTRDPDWVTILISVSAQRFLEFERHGTCYDNQDLIELGRKSQPLHGALELVRQCSDVNCPYLLNFKGWRVDVLVSRRVYHLKERYCGFAVAMLEKWTEHVD